MKIFSGGKQLSPSAARNCFLVNQFATPGLGSLMGGRVLSGLGQLLLAVVGCGLVMFWFFKTMKQYYSIAGDEMAAPADVSYASYALAGFFIFIASWLWSLLTSISIVRSAKVPEPPTPGSVPPRITNIPPKM
jgi:hypothetical protein